MKRNLKYVIILFAIFFAVIANTCDFHASTDEYIKALNNMSDEARWYYGGYQGIARTRGYDYAMQCLYENYKSDPGPVLELLNIMATYSPNKEWIAEANAAGVPVGSAITTSAETQNNEPQVAVPTAFTVEDLSPYPAWATQDCNIRSGADTTYDKAGSLSKYEQVTVTGKASTGWFRIITASGLEAYISDALLTTEDPTNREYTTVNNEGETYEFTDTKPEVIDEIIEKIEEENKEEPVHEHSYTSVVTKEATCTETGTKTYTCECGDTYIEEIPMSEHIAGEWEETRAATMFAPGEKAKRCTVCGEILETEGIPAKTMILYILCGVAALAIILSIVFFKRKHNI